MYSLHGSENKITVLGIVIPLLTLISSVIVLQIADLYLINFLEIKVLVLTLGLPAIVGLVVGIYLQITDS